MPALIRALVAAPHLVRDLQYLLQAFEALSQRGKGDAEALGLEGGARPGRGDVPRRARADAEDHPAAGQHVKRRHRFDQHAWVAVGHGCHERAEPDPSRQPAQEGERRVRLGHGRGRRQPAQPDLEEVVHNPEAVHAGLVRRRGDPGYGRPDLLGRPGKRSDADAELHSCLLAVSGEACWPRSRPA